MSINGNVSFDPSSTQRTIFGHSDILGLDIYGNSNAGNGALLRLFGADHTTHGGQIDLISSVQNADYSGKGWSFGTHDSGPTPSVWTEALKLLKDGTLGLYNNIVFEPQTFHHRGIYGKGAQTGLDLYANTNAGDGALLRLFGENHPNGGQIDFVSSVDNGNYAATGWTFSTHYPQPQPTPSIWTNALELKKDGTLIPNGNIEFASNTNSWHRSILGRSVNGGLFLTPNTSWTDGASIIMDSDNKGGDISFTSTSGVANEAAYVFHTNGVTNEAFRINKDGKVRVGPSGIDMNPNYNLFVTGGILTEKLKVATVGGGNWSDYVFADDYKLNNLNDVEAFISKNKHLPDVPSAEDVEENGYDVTEMDATLLRKIEELTLYVIEQQKEIQMLKSKMNK